MKEGRRKRNAFGLETRRLCGSGNGLAQKRQLEATSPGLCAPAQANLTIIVLLRWRKREEGEPPGAPWNGDDHQWQRWGLFKADQQIRRVCFHRFSAGRAEVARIPRIGHYEGWHHLSSFQWANQQVALLWVWEEKKKKRENPMGVNFKRVYYK